MMTEIKISVEDLESKGNKISLKVQQKDERSAE